MKGVEVKMNYSKSDKNKLIEHLNAVINTEMEKPYEEIDADLIDACTELILELQGKNFTLSNEEVEELVRKIPFAEVADFKATPQKKRKKTTKRKILLIAAVTAILSTLLSIRTSGDREIELMEYLETKYGSLANVPRDEQFILGNQEYSTMKKCKVYTDPKDLMENEGINILFPTDIPDKIKFDHILSTEADNTVIVAFDPAIAAYGIQLDTEIPQIIKDRSSSFSTENGLLCYIERIKSVGQVQIYFEHDGNFYTVSGNNEQILMDIVENLEEYK